MVKLLRKVKISALEMKKVSQRSFLHFPFSLLHNHYHKLLHLLTGLFLLPNPFLLLLFLQALFPLHIFILPLLQHLILLLLLHHFLLQQLLLLLQVLSLLNHFNPLPPRRTFSTLVSSSVTVYSPSSPNPTLTPPP